jgi:thiol-disulfide isomerase/thioredoxin
LMNKYQVRKLIILAGTTIFGIVVIVGIAAGPDATAKYRFIEGGRLLGGNDVSGISELASENVKYVVMTYFTTWCPTCEQQIETLVKLHNSTKNDDRILIVGVNVGESESKVQKYVDEHKIKFPVIIGIPTPPSSGVPYTVILTELDGQWAVVDEFIGARSQSQIIASLQKAGWP